MCRIGDIIVVNGYIGEDGKEIGQHSFIVIDDKPSSIKGLKYDLVANVMSSFHDEGHKKRRLAHKENLLVESEDIISSYKNSREGYIKADQLHYFDKNNLDYYVFGSISSDLLDELVQLIIELEVEDKLKQNTQNLSETA